MVKREEVVAAAAETTGARPATEGQPRCTCGRFARWVGDRHYYNGSFSCYSYTVDCTRCGTQTVECV